MPKKSISPEASVILVASEGRRSILKVIERLQVQSVANKLEILIACHGIYAEELRSLSTSSFHGVRVIEADLSTSARARAAAIKEATADIVVFAEDHALPIGIQWAEDFIQSHQYPHAAVGPVIRNANPATVTSWANLVIEYGPWLHRREPGPAVTIAGHNSSYKREILIQYNDRLACMLESEWVLHLDLIGKGHTLWIDPKIQVEHINFSLVNRAVQLRFFGGWMFAASRAKTWTIAKRLFYAISFPAIATTRFLRLCRHFLNSPEASPHAWRCLPASFFYLLCDASGEAIGYTFGDLGKRPRLGQLEYHRWKNIIKSESDFFYQPPIEV